MGSVRLEESGEWSGGVPECRTAHAAHQQRVERGGRRPRRSLSSFQGRQKNFRNQPCYGPATAHPPTVEEEGAFCS